MIPLKYNIVYDSPWLEVREIVKEDGRYYYTHAGWCDGQAVAILPYMWDAQKDRIMFLLREENVPPWNGNSLCSITGGMESGELPIEAACRELWEEAGYVIKPNSDRWLSLGQCRVGKMTDTMMNLYAVHVKDVEQSIPIGDGSVWEKDSTCVWTSHPHESPDPLASIMSLRFLERTGFRTSL